MLACASIAALGFTGAMRTAPAAAPRAVVRMDSLDSYAGASIEMPLANGKPWDPLGFSKVGELQTPGSLPSVNPSLKWLREAELKHCRIAMMAFLGVVVQELLGLRLSSTEAFSDSNWFTAWQTFSIKNPGGAAQILFAIMLQEGKNFPHEMWEGGGDRAPGDWGFDPLGLSKNKSPDQVAKLQLSELKNGRAAMIAIMALSSSKFIPGSVPGL